jgi:hypothetical protein
MADWMRFETPIRNNANRRLCVVKDEHDPINGKRFLRSTVIHQGQTAKGYGVFPCDAQGRIQPNARGIKFVTTGFMGAGFEIHRDGRATTMGNLGGRAAGFALQTYKAATGKEAGEMTFKQFEHVMNGGQRTEIYNQNDQLLANFRVRPPQR